MKECEPQRPYEEHYDLSECVRLTPCRRCSRIRRSLSRAPSARAKCTGSPCACRRPASFWVRAFERGGDVSAGSRAMFPADARSHDGGWHVPTIRLVPDVVAGRPRAIYRAEALREPALLDQILQHRLGHRAAADVAGAHLVTGKSQASGRRQGIVVKRRIRVGGEFEEV